ncbi:hypothetical protein BH11ARM2_BH11ARM2_35390 [soil metagenome]
MKSMTLGRWAAPAAVAMIAGCGGSGSFAQPVPFRATLEAGSVSDQLTMIVTRSNEVPATGNDCRLDKSPPDWCSANFQSLSFNVQPSFTLYRVYVRNLSSTNTASARVRIDRDGDDKGTATATIPAGQDRWFWELGVETVNNKTN